MGGTVRITVRNDAIDVNGHVRQDVYLAYAAHARWETTRLAGATHDMLRAAGIGPIDLETTVRFRHELVLGDQLDVATEFVWGEGKTFRIRQQLVRLDGVVAAEVESVGGVMDLRERRLVNDPRDAWLSVVDKPAQLNLQSTHRGLQS